MLHGAADIVGVGKRPIDQRRNRGQRRVDLAQIPVLAVTDEIGGKARPRGDRHDVAHHRLDQRNRTALEARQRYKHVKFVVERGIIGVRALAILEIREPHELGEAWIAIPVAAHEEERSFRQGADEFDDPFRALAVVVGRTQPDFPAAASVRTKELRVGAAEHQRDLPGRHSHIDEQVAPHRAHADEPGAGEDSNGGRAAKVPGFLLGVRDQYGTGMIPEMWVFPHRFKIEVVVREEVAARPGELIEHAGECPTALKGGGDLPADRLQDPSPAPVLHHEAEVDLGFPAAFKRPDPFLERRRSQERRFLGRMPGRPGCKRRDPQRGTLQPLAKRPGRLRSL